MLCAWYPGKQCRLLHLRFCGAAAGEDMKDQRHTAPWHVCQMHTGRCNAQLATCIQHSHA